MQVSNADLRSRLRAEPNALALIDRHGTAIDYGTLVDMADAWAARMGTTRSLFFVEASNDREAVAAYVACLLNRHPVYLFGGQDEEMIRGLAERYRPAAIVRPLDTDPFHWRDSPHRGFHADLAVLLSTSGSTGSPKFVKLSLSNIVSNALSIAEYLSIDQTERAITSLPFNYSYGLSVVNSHLFVGASLLLDNGSVTEAGFWERFRAFEATSFAGVPYSFEMLAVADPAWTAIPSLRYVTQAGGSLPPGSVRHFADLGKLNGWRFYVMYGQTECAPRIAYLPPDQAVDHPECIGVPIPGGSIELIGEDGTLVTGHDTPGELVYSGPNVMMGYADAATDLADRDMPKAHRTGDIACQNEAGLFYIVGRLSRFVKPFGLRINLDELQARLGETTPGTVCTGSDDVITVALLGDNGDKDNEEAVLARLMGMLKLPAAAFQVVSLDAVPLLANGKIDYQAILALAETGKVSSEQRRGSVGAVVSGRFVRQVLVEVGKILGIVRPRWEGVRHIYSTVLNLPSVESDSSFVSLAGDSLSYVQATIALQQYLGHLPHDWEIKTVDELEQEAPVEQAF